MPRKALNLCMSAILGGTGGRVKLPPSLRAGAPEVSKKTVCRHNSYNFALSGPKTLILCEEQMSVKAQEFVKHYFRAIAIPTLCILLAVVCPAQLVGKKPFRPGGEIERNSFRIMREIPAPPRKEPHDMPLLSLISTMTEHRRRLSTSSARVVRVAAVCSSLVLEPKGSSFKVITRTTITRLPIRVLSEKNKWLARFGGLGRGGGIRPGYEARLRFNGKKYPSNPSGPPAQRLQKKARGENSHPGQRKRNAPLW